MSAFVGWTFAGGEALTYSATPIVGWVGGDVRGPIGGLEASLAWRKFDYYIEIEYVHDQRERESSYVYAWSELAYRPADWLRLGLRGAADARYQSDRDIQPRPVRAGNVQAGHRGRVLVQSCFVGAGGGGVDGDRVLAQRMARTAAIAALRNTCREGSKPVLHRWIQLATDPPAA